MKRFISTIIVLTLILGCIAACRAENPGDILEVCNCSEYVTLRREPDTKSEGITHVFKGALVQFGDYAANDFYYVSFGADNGYILSKYLKNAEPGSDETVFDPEETEEIPAGFDELPALPPYADFMVIGDPVCETVYGGYHIVARRAVSFDDDREELLAVC